MDNFKLNIGRAAFARIAVLSMAIFIAATAAAASSEEVSAKRHVNPVETARLNRELLEAARQDDASKVSTLLRKYASVNAAQGDGMTSLHWAAHNDDLSLAKELLHYGADPNARTCLGGLTALYMAAENGDASLLQLLLQAGAKVDALNDAKTTPLMIASASGSVAAVEVLLAHGANVNAREGSYGQTALFFAVAHNRADVVRLLLSKGADPTIKTSITKLARVTVGVNGEEQDEKKGAEAKIASDAGSANASAKESKEEGNAADPKGVAVSVSGSKATAKPDDRMKDAYGLTAADRKKRVYGTMQIGGMTALLIAARDGQSAAVNALLDAHDDINQTSDTDHATALVLAVINGHYDLAKILLDRGANPNLTTSDGVSPLYAVLDVQWAPHTWYPQPIVANEHIGYLDLALALLEHGADPNVTIKKKLWFRVFANDETWFEMEGATPFLRAAVAGDLAAMKLLAEHGADPNIKTVSGDTSLMAAAGIGWAAYWTANAPYARIDTVKFCLEHGADVKAADVKGYTALHGAAFRGDNEMVEYLIAQGADVRARTKDGDTVADFANGLFEHAMVHPETVALLEQHGSANSHNCRSNECVVPPKEDKAAAVITAEPAPAKTAPEATLSAERKSK